MFDYHRSTPSSLMSRNTYIKTAFVFISRSLINLCQFPDEAMKILHTDIIQVSFNKSNIFRNNFLS